MPVSSSNGRQTCSSRAAPNAPPLATIASSWPWEAVDPSKFGQRDRYRVCEMSAIDILVTDCRPDQRLIERLADQGAEVLHP